MNIYLDTSWKVYIFKAQIKVCQFWCNNWWGKNTIDRGVLNNGIARVPGGKDSPCQCRRCGFSLWVGKIPWRRAWQLASVFLPRKFYGQRSLVGYSLWGHRVGCNSIHDGRLAKAVQIGGERGIGVRRHSFFRDRPRIAVRRQLFQGWWQHLTHFKLQASLIFISKDTFSSVLQEGQMALSWLISESQGSGEQAEASGFS